MDQQLAEAMSLEQRQTMQRLLRVECALERQFGMSELLVEAEGTSLTIACRLSALEAQQLQVQAEPTSGGVVDAVALSSTVRALEQQVSELSTGVSNCGSPSRSRTRRDKSRYDQTNVLDAEADNLGIHMATKVCPKRGRVDSVTCSLGQCSAFREQFEALDEQLRKLSSAHETNVSISGQSQKQIDRWLQRLDDDMGRANVLLEDLSQHMMHLRADVTKEFSIRDAQKGPRAKLGLHGDATAWAAIASARQ